MCRLLVAGAIVSCVKKNFSNITNSKVFKFNEKSNVDDAPGSTKIKHSIYIAAIKIPSGRDGEIAV